MAKKPTETEGRGLIDVDQAAKLLKLTARRVQQLATQGVVPKAGPGKYPMVGLVHGYIEYLQEQITRNTRVAADSRLRDARARKVELEIAQREGELISLDEAMECFERVTGLFITTLEGMPARITRNAREQQRITDISDAVRRKIRDDFAEIRDDLLAALRSSTAGGSGNAGRVGEAPSGLPADGGRAGAEGAEADAIRDRAEPRGGSADA